MRFELLKAPSFLALVYLMSICGLACCLAGCTSSTVMDEHSAELAAMNDLSVQTASDPQKTYPPVFNGTRIEDNDPILQAEKAAEEIQQTLYGEAPNRVFVNGWLAGDSARFQLVEDWDYPGKVWQFDYVQTTGDFSALQFPQIGEGDQPFELHREYSFAAGELFFVSESIFAQRTDGSEVIHRNKYVFADGQLTHWYRDVERYQVNERFFGLAKQLFPQVNGQALLSWADAVYADPVSVDDAFVAMLEDFVNLLSEGSTMDEAVNDWVRQATDRSPIIVGGERLAGDEYTQPVIWLSFAPGYKQQGAVFTIDWGMMGAHYSLDDGLLLGFAYNQREYCQTPGDFIASFDWARREQRLDVLREWVHPEEGLAYIVFSGEGDDIGEHSTPRAKLSLEMVPNPLAFNSLENDETFDSEGFARWSWSLPGSSEEISIRKTETGIYWSGFEGAYH